MGNQTTQPAPAKKSSAMYLGMRLCEASREIIDILLADLTLEAKTTYVNHHITVVFSPSWQHCAFAGLSAWAAVTGVLVNDTHVVIEVGEVSVESWDGVWQDLRPVMDLISDTTSKGRKGQRYHVTHSLTSGAKAKDSNLLLSGEVESTRHKTGAVVFGSLYWANSKGEEHASLDRLKKCPEISVGAARTIFTGVGSHHSGDGHDFLGCFSEDIRQGLEMIAPFGRPGCGRWPMSVAMAECTRVGMVRPDGRAVSVVPHRDDMVPTVQSNLVTEEVCHETSSVITFGLAMMLLDPDDERENGTEEALAEKKRLIASNGRLFAIAVIANGSDVPDAPPPSVHRCQQKVINGEPLPEGELERARSYWYSTNNTSGWVLVDYTDADD